MEKRNHRMGIGEMDALHMDGGVRYISHREHAKFFAIVDGKGIYHFRGDGYVHLGDNLESWFDQRL
jgi:hypothetical protein